MKILLDSGILIEYEKQSKTELLDALLESDHQIFINPIVFSEYIYQLLGILGGRSPMSICESGKINETLSNHDTKTFLSCFQVLSIPDAALPLAVDYMKQYNLLPNDALLIASCKIHSISVVASYDADFFNACKEEGIELVTKVADLSRLQR
ncbi:MAG: PIN domain-containing protein [Saprospiraceae bacterium]|nr:PIN domain-containing protein [Saprospiraceae bacterium]